MENSKVLDDFMVEDFIKTAHRPFLFFYSFFFSCCGPCSKQIFVLFIAFFFVIYSSLLQLLILLDILDFMVNL